MLQREITNLKRKILDFATLVETMIEGTISKGLLRRDREYLLRVIEEEEPKANDMEVDMDKESTRVIAQYQPTAKDLRGILMMIMMNNDLERMADHAVNIAESSLYLIERAPVKPLIDIPQMAEIVINMLKEGIDSFMSGDAELSRKVCEKDRIVDGYRDQIFRELLTFMSADPTTIERSFHLIRISASLERIADLSTNICEDVIFMLEGTFIKHGKEE